MSDSLRWFGFENWDGRHWRVDASSHESSQELRGRPGSLGNDGVTIPERRLILVDSGARRTVQDYTVLHEVMHASLDGVEGISWRTEERVIREMAPRLFPILRRFGLQWPGRPEGFLALERKARRGGQ